MSTSLEEAQKIVELWRLLVLDGVLERVDLEFEFLDGVLERVDLVFEFLDGVSEWFGQPRWKVTTLLA